MSRMNIDCLRTAVRYNMIGGEKTDKLVKSDVFYNYDIYNIS
jgi:hypothetical protein